MPQNSYKTKQRTLILKCLKDNKDRHITAEEIHEYLLRGGESVGMTTIYRNLDKLLKEGQLRRYELAQGQSACFQYVDGDIDCREHFHLKCEGCGRLIHLDCDDLAKLSQHIEKEHAFYLNSSKTVLYGLCADCKTQKDK